MTETAYAWAPITKSEKQDDGTLLVYGPAASSDLDRDQQRLNAEWLDRAMPTWLREGANVREQHDGRKAVGVGIALTKDDSTGAHLLTARIVDPVAVKKIEHGVLRGFSVGIKDPKVVMGKADAPGGEIVDGQVIEVSVCDRPCNPTTLFQMAKADGAGDLQPVDEPHLVEQPDMAALPDIRSKADLRKAIRAVEDVDDDTERLRDHILTRADALGLQAMVPATWLTVDEPDAAKADKYNAKQRKQMASSGEAMDDGSYPIADRDDLEKAIKAVGRGGADHDAIRKHVIARAKALKLADLIPDNWNSDGSLKDTAKADEPTGQEATMPELSKTDTETAVNAETAPDAETVAAAARILADLAELGLPEVSKADEPTGEPAGEADGGAEGDDEADDIAGAQEAIACIAALIISEARSLAAGNLSEACDISCLLDAVAALKWFICRERSEESGDDLMLADATTTGPDAPDLVKTDQPAPPADTTDTPAATKDGQGSDEATTLKAEIAELVKAAVAEATTASEERIKTLEAELAQVKALPEPGGPVLTRTAVQEATARKADGDLLRAQANAYLEKAERASDPYLAQGYRDKATALLAKADA